MRFLSYLPLLATAACVPLGTPITTDASGAATATKPPEYYADKTLRYQDYTYSPDVRSVQCYVAAGTQNDVFQPPIVPLAQNQPIVLEFDVLGEAAPRLSAKLVHCDYNWQPSLLTDMQFLSDINDFLLTNYRTGVGGKVPYYHYQFAVPRVKLSGNYLLLVQGAGGVPLLSRRLVVYQSEVQVSLQPGIVAGGQERYTLQQLDFAINYGAAQLVNPAVEVKVVLRQNFRWDNAKFGLRPTFVSDFDRQLKYQYFNFENAFPGLAEYRAFDLRSILAPALAVQSINQKATPRAVVLVPETSWDKLAYNQYVDTNGQRVFESREYGEGRTNADYADVTFQLRAEKPAPGPVYVLGALTDWQLKDEFRLTYSDSLQLYQGHALLKQGYYNYSFAVASSTGAADETYFQGSHYETENQYDLLVYYRPPGARTDLIIGYQQIDMNGRQ